MKVHGCVTKMRSASVLALCAISCTLYSCKTRSQNDSVASSLKLQQDDVWYQLYVAADGTTFLNACEKEDSQVCDLASTSMSLSELRVSLNRALENTSRAFIESEEKFQIPQEVSLDYQDRQLLEQQINTLRAKVSKKRLNILRFMPSGLSVDGMTKDDLNKAKSELKKAETELQAEQKRQSELDQERVQKAEEISKYVYNIGDALFDVIRQPKEFRFQFAKGPMAAPRESLSRSENQEIMQLLDKQSAFGSGVYSLLPAVEATSEVILAKALEPLFERIKSTAADALERQKKVAELSQAKKRDQARKELIAEGKVKRKEFETCTPQYHVEGRNINYPNLRYNVWYQDLKVLVKKLEVSHVRDWYVVEANTLTVSKCDEVLDAFEVKNLSPQQKTAIRMAFDELFKQQIIFYEIKKFIGFQLFDDNEECVMADASMEKKNLSGLKTCP